MWFQMPTVASSALWSRRAIGMLVCGIVAISGSLASGASSSTVVSAQVPSATSVNATACAASTPGVTEFGTILPGSTAVTTADCVITWGSSNDSSMLRAYQSDGRDTGMGAASQIWSLRGTRDQYSHGAVSAATNSIAYLAVGGNGMASTTDGGATWSDQSAASHVFDVSGSPASTNIAAASTSGGQIYRTTNSGATAWTLETSGVTTSLNSVSLADDTNGFAVGVGGVIRRRTTAGGATWAAVTSPVTSTLNGVDAVSATEAFAVGYGDVLLRTGTGGATWSVPASTCFGNYGDVAASDAFTAYAVGLSGVVVKLTWNSGTSVLTCTSLTAAVDIGEDLAGVSVAPGSSTVYVSGALGTVMRSTNGGTTWQRMPTGTSVDLNGISSQPDGSLWAAGSNRTVLRAPTATTFTHRRSGGTDSTSLADIAAVSSTTAYAVGGQVDRGGTWQAAIRRTTDRGATWTSLTSNTSSALLGVSASADGVLVMAVGEDGTIARSTDSGATWTATSWAPGTRLWDIDMFDEYSGWAVGDGGTILRTSNGGT
ncbi:MAG: type sorting protein, partial [Thermoleophilia bacterium]|nr:type sorting protein [Thermoleophilia bacterium]